MPVETGMTDIKWIVILMLITGGTNIAQYLGIAAPEAKVATETQAANEMIRDELHLCMKELKECYSQCGTPRNMHWDLGAALETLETPVE
jgi:hypothetical protein